MHLKYSTPKEIPVFFQEVKRIGRNREKITKPYPLSYPYLRTNYSLLIGQDLWQAHHRFLLIISLKESIQLNVNMDIIIKYMKNVELKTKIVIVILTTQTLKIIY